MITICDKRIKRLDRWKRKCPKCGTTIHFSLRSSRLGASGPARCGEHLESSRIFDAGELREGRVRFCDWAGYAIRMWDGSVRFMEKNGRYLSED
jgi:predicted RNA-binding Zn-ribbon protein involved in translation (DUF1610 family)